MDIYKEKAGLYIVCLFFCLAITACGKQAPSQKNMTIAVAASAYDAIRALADAYTHEKGHKVDIIRASSGQLSAQILQSAPYALFFSADENYPEFLIENGASASPVRVYAYGHLSIWLQKDNARQALAQYLKSAAVKKIALANTTTAPYGKAAYKWMEENNILAAVEHKLVYGESIAQVNTYILSQAVDAAFTNQASLTLVDQSILENMQRIPQKKSFLLPQAMIITRYGMKYFPKQSQSFFNFALTQKGQAILKSFGYDTP